MAADPRGSAALQAVVMARMAYAGETAAGEKAIAPIRTLATPLADMVRPIRYPACSRRRWGRC